MIFLTALEFLKGLPWQLYVVAALLALLPVTYCKGRSDGKEAIYAKLEAAEQKAAAKAAKAKAGADKEQQEAAETFEAEQKALTKAIEDAKADGENPLDAIM